MKLFFLIFELCTSIFEHYMMTYFLRIFKKKKKKAFNTISHEDWIQFLTLNFFFYLSPMSSTMNISISLFTTPTSHSRPSRSSKHKFRTITHSFEESQKMSCPTTTTKCVCVCALFQIRRGEQIWSTSSNTYVPTRLMSKI